VSYYTVLRPLNWTLQKTRIFVKAREVYKIQTPSFLGVTFSSLSMTKRNIVTFLTHIYSELSRQRRTENIAVCNEEFSESR